MDSAIVQRLAVPGVCILVAFLSYSSQLLFPRIDPGPLTSRQKLVFNALVAGIWVSYARAVLTDAGHVPEGWKLKEQDEGEQSSVHRSRYCRKCAALKPPRAHHCKVCKRSVNHQNRVYMELISTDVYQKWITIARGRQIASLIALFLTSCGSSFMQ